MGQLLDHSETFFYFSCSMNVQYSELTNKESYYAARHIFGFLEHENQMQGTPILQLRSGLSEEIKTNTFAFAQGAGAILCGQ